MSEGVAGPGVPVGFVAEHRPPWVWSAALAAGVVATALTWAAGEASVDRFRQKAVKNPLAESADLAGFNRIVVKNATLAYGLQGALLGLTLGLAGAAARRAPHAAAPAGLTGLVIGGALGAGASFGLFTAFYALADANSHDMIPSLLAHAGVASLLGATGGAAFGLGLGGGGRVARAAVGGLAGAAIGAGLYEVAGAVLFPVDQTGEPVAASWTARLLAHALVDLPAALGAAAVVEAPARAPRGDRLTAAP